MTVQYTFEHIYHQHKGRIYYYLHTLRIPVKLHDEFYAEGMYALWQAYEQYDCTKGELSTFLNYRIRFTMIDLIRKKERNKRVTEKIINEQKVILHQGNHNRNKGQLLFPNEEIQIQDDAIWLYLQKRLTKRQWKWIYYYIISDLSLKEIAHIENVSVEAVKGWAKTTRNKLRKDPTFKMKLLCAIQTK